MEAHLEILIKCLGCESRLLQIKDFFSSGKGLTGNNGESCSCPEDKLLCARSWHSVSAQHKNTALLPFLPYRAHGGGLRASRLLLGDRLLKTVPGKMLSSMFLNNKKNNKQKPNKTQITSGLCLLFPIFPPQTRASILMLERQFLKNSCGYRGGFHSSILLSGITFIFCGPLTFEVFISPKSTKLIFSLSLES